MPIDVFATLLAGLAACRAFVGRRRQQRFGRQRAQAHQRQAAMPRQHGLQHLPHGLRRHQLIVQLPDPGIDGAQPGLKFGQLSTAVGIRIVELRFQGDDLVVERGQLGLACRQSGAQIGATASGRIHPECHEEKSDRRRHGHRHHDLLAPAQRGMAVGPASPERLHGAAPGRAASSSGPSANS